MVARSYFQDLNWEWWEYIYEDAKRVGINIRGFDSYYNVSGEIIDSSESAAYAILREHGEECLSYKKAQEFLAEYILMEAGEDKTYATLNFLRDICRCYSKMLQEEYDYLTSEEEIKERMNAECAIFKHDGTLPEFHELQDEKRKL